MRKILYFSRQIGLDPLRFVRGIRNLPRYFSDLMKFRKLTRGNGKFRLSPVLNDFNDQAGSADGHYFWQDLIAAQWVHSLDSENHLDVGSRIDGFIAHLLSFRKVTLLDIRPMKHEIPNLKIILANAQNNLSDEIGLHSSVSSLHSIEHFGLGRYGDSLDPLGHEKGIIAISECVGVKGSLIVSFPIGRSTIEFNEQRIIDPIWPIQILENFELHDFVLIPWKGVPELGKNPQEVDKSQTGQAGLYWFIKK